VPTREQFPLLIAAIRSKNGKPEAKDGADFVELVAYSGMRKAEAAALKWQDVDFDKNQLTVTGEENHTKNYETRTVSLNDDLCALLLRLRSESSPLPTENVTKIALANYPFSCRGVEYDKAGQFKTYRINGQWHGIA
jgi:integrase